MANNYPEYILTGQTPAATYQNLVQLTVESQSLVTGYGNEIDTVLNVTTSYAVSASWPLPSVGGGSSLSVSASATNFAYGLVLISGSSTQSLYYDSSSGITYNPGPDILTVNVVSSSAIFASGSTSVSPINVVGSSNNFSEIQIQNLNNGTAASSDFVATNNIGSQNTYYVDLGINSSGYTAAQVGQSDDSYLYNTGSSSSSLYIGAADVSGSVYLFAGGLVNTSSGMVISSTAISSFLPISASHYGTSSWATNAVTSQASSQSFVASVGNTLAYNLALLTGSNSTQSIIFDASSGITYNPGPDILTVNLITASQLFGTSSWATNVVNAGGGGTTLFTASTYQITSSWATNAVNGPATPVSITQSYMNIPVNTIIPIGFLSGSTQGPNHQFPPIPLSASVYNTWYGQASSSVNGYVPYMMFSYLEFPFMGNITGSSSLACYQMNTPPNYKIGTGFTMSLGIFVCADPVTAGYYFEVGLFAVTTGSSTTNPYNLITSSYLVSNGSTSASLYSGFYGGMSKGGSSQNPVSLFTLPDPFGYVQPNTPLIFNIARKSGPSDTTTAGLGILTCGLQWTVN